MDREQLMEVIAAYEERIDSGGELPFVARGQLARELRGSLNGLSGADSFLVRVGLECARFSWHVWGRKFPGENDIIDTAVKAVDGIADEGKADEGVVAELGGLLAHLHGKFELGDEYFAGIYAGYAAWAVVRDAVSLGQGEDPLASSGPELEVNSDDWEPCFFSSLAIVGGSTWDGFDNPDARRGFWKWYLTSAVPVAYNQVTQRADHDDDRLS
ncbi:MAG: hypothetical protein J2P31_11700 [Blastocatellia bacterium]|nr:hypothetical protein [Blastocatellia bacterium]